MIIYSTTIILPFTNLGNSNIYICPGQLLGYISPLDLIAAIVATVNIIAGTVDKTIILKINLDNAPLPSTILIIDIDPFFIKYTNMSSH